MISDRIWVLVVGLCIGLSLAGCAAAPASTPVVTPSSNDGLRVVPLSVSDAGVPTFTPLAEQSIVEDVLTPAPLLTTESPLTPEPLALLEHQVQPGDTLLGLALEYDLPMAAIQLQNDLGTATNLQAGQNLQLPPAVVWEGATPFWLVYEVLEGEVLSTIAASYGFELSVLQQVNGIGDGDILSIGQALILPLEAPVDLLAQAQVVASTPVPLPTPVPTQAPLAVPETPLESTAEQPEPAPELTPEPTVVPQPVVAPPADISAWAGEIFNLINAERAAYGLPPLLWNATLARAAQLHADDCDARGWCGHTGSDGTTMKQRIIRQGYNPVRWSECWAWYGSPQAAVAAWMDEVPPNDPHRRTILSTWLTEVGVGLVPGNPRGYYFIADFGTPGE